LTRLARVTFLGTGTSHGVPMIACDCPTCRSTDPRDRRWRPSLLVEMADGTVVLVDT
jgi:phosphoribosyl 1,2-cyclic phosphate phosphodiesterase